MKAIILCAGYATRMYPLTENQPKPLLPIGGKPLLDYIVDKIDEIPSIDEKIIVSNHKFAPHFQRWAEDHNDVRVIDDGSTTNDDRLGAIKDMIYAMNDIDDDVLVIAGDNLIEFSLKQLYDDFVKYDSTVLAGYDTKDIEIAKRHGIVVLDDLYKIVDFQEKPESPKSTVKALCCYMFKSGIKPLLGQYIGEGNNTDATGFFLEWLVKKTEAYAHVFEESVFDIGNLESYKKADELYSKK